MLCFIEAAVRRFLSYYRDSFPDSSMTPKMHFLEEHVVPWICHWRVGLSFHGEQGAESIHAKFNDLSRAHSSSKGQEKSPLQDLCLFFSVSCVGPPKASEEDN